MSRRLTIKEQEEAACIAKFLWQRRNESIYQNQFFHPNSLIRQSRNKLTNFTLAALPSNFPHSDGPNSNTIKWHKPPTGSLKINWDATCNSQIQKIGTGAIIRDETGIIMGTIRTVRNFNPDTFVAEEIALVIAV